MQPDGNCDFDSLDSRLELRSLAGITPSDSLDGHHSCRCQFVLGPRRIVGIAGAAPLDLLLSHRPQTSPIRSLLSDEGTPFNVGSTPPSYLQVE